MDKTLEISFLEQGAAVVRVRFGQPKVYTFGWDLVTILERPERMPPGARLLVDGDVVEAAEGYLFTGPISVRARRWTMRCGIRFR
ncbi:hypothetical protein KHQ06_14465 [Nocardia tengchongensis]|uniref:Uncharacterized protein n=1 Tax=Nocardia tengchongensis TaxID=2055889 RepID=A0ABX8CVH7_9NOCA|nr:hypothetical protein [Nocardia tengchongensis]QVI23900.1 hypothetical protein KHQ06_14465 [Nocardia tengchongensis]